MTEAEARARILADVRANDHPTLTAAGADNEVGQLLEIARTRDADGIAPSEDNWTETWDLARAAATGWTWKAGKAAGAFAVSTDGETMRREQVHQHCLNMAKIYKRRGYSIPLTSSTTIEREDSLDA